jgi:DNA adenine methylase
MKLLSPLRYPGGKAGLAPFLTDVLDLNDIRGVDYFEPYAGGAGAALALLVDRVVSRISINDADFRIYAFWRTVLDEPEWLVDKIMAAKLDIQEWKELRETCLFPSGKSTREVGFAVFYMNRCNRSGVRLVDTSKSENGGWTFASPSPSSLSAYLRSLNYANRST